MTTAMKSDVSMPGLAARVLLFPTVLVDTQLAAWSALARGWEASAVLGAVSFATVVIVAIAERLIPFDPDWNRSRGDVVTDVLHSLISSYGARELFKIVLVMMLLPVATSIASMTGGGVWPVAWPAAAQVALAALVAELGQYWAHRISHENELFWRLHAVHHSPERLYWLNAGRDHPLGVIWLYAWESAFLIVLGCPPECITAFFVFESAHGLMQHANVDFRLGPLNWIFSAAPLHRWHHSERVSEANHNYGANLIIWDIIFGTRYLPNDRRAPSRLGIQDVPDFPRSFAGQLTVPFRPEILQPGEKST